MLSLFKILFFVAGYYVLKIIVEIFQNRKCPKDEVLRKVVLGRTKRNSQLAQKVTRHLGSCATCQSKVEMIANMQ